jgi:hypothetical protein
VQAEYRTELDVVSAVDFETCQDEQGTQEACGSSGVGTELGEDPPVLEVSEAVFDRCASDGEDSVDGLLAGGEL